MEGKFLQGPKGEPVKPRVTKIKNTSGDDLYQEPLPAERAVVKHEVYALSTILMEHYHRKTMEELEKNPEGVKKILTEKMFNLLSAFFKANLGSEPRDIWKVEDQMLTVNTEMMDNLSDDEFYGLMTSSQGLSNAYKGVFASLATDTPGAQKMPDRENAAYHRLADLLTVSKFRPKPASFNKKETYLPEEFVLRGANTAAISTWTLLLSVVLEYNQEYGAPMTPEVLDSVTSDVRKILTQVASLQIFDFGDFDDFRIAKTGEKKQPGFSWQSVIVMTGPAAAPRIRLNAEFLESFEDYIGERDYEEFQHGCPAIIAEGEDGNMITDFVNFYEGLAKRALLPHQERFVTLAQKI